MSVRSILLFAGVVGLMSVMPTRVSAQCSSGGQGSMSNRSRSQTLQTFAYRQSPFNQPVVQQRQLNAILQTQLQQQLIAAQMWQAQQRSLQMLQAQAMAASDSVLQNALQSTSPLIRQTAAAELVRRR